MNISFETGGRFSEARHSFHAAAAVRKALEGAPGIRIARIRIEEQRPNPGRLRRLSVRVGFIDATEVLFEETDGSMRDLLERLTLRLRRMQESLADREGVPV